MAVLALAAGSAGAQTTRTYATVEARICQAREVVRGSITNLTRTVAVEPGGRDAGGTTWPDGIVDYAVTVRAVERLKGARTDELRLAQRTSAFDRRLEQWREARTSFLWFVGKAGAAAAGPESSWSALRLDPPVAAETTYTTDAPPVFGTDLRVLREPAVILIRARQFARRKRDCAIYRLTVPGPVAQLCAPGADANFIEVPADGSLRETAQRLVASPETFLPEDSPFHGSQPIQEMLRAEGRKALEHLRTLDRT